MGLRLLAGRRWRHPACNPGPAQQQAVGTGGFEGVSQKLRTRRRS